MNEPHFFDANEQEWMPHPQFAGILTKALETRATYPAASVQLVRVEPGVTISRHTHPLETETAYVLAGQGVITLGEAEHPLLAGTGLTIPPGIPHSLTNTGAEPMELYAIHIPPTR